MDNYTWNAQSQRMLADAGGNVVTMTYNGLGQRTAKETSGGWCARYDGKNLIQETDGSDDLTTSYTTTDEEFGDLISEHDFVDGGIGTGEFYQQFDAQSAANAMLDDSGSVVQKYRFKAFGLLGRPIPAGMVRWAGPSLGVADWAALTTDGWANLTVNPWSVTGANRFVWGGKKQYQLDSELELYFLGAGNIGAGGNQVF